MEVTYKINEFLTTEEFVILLKESTLAERRPVDDYDCMEGMLSNSNLIVTAWLGSKLVGIARALTDFHYACYLSDLAVSKKYQNRGIGKMLQIKMQEQLTSNCKLILISAPDANTYYEYIGYVHNDRCWILERDALIS